MCSHRTPRLYIRCSCLSSPSPTERSDVVHRSDCRDQTRNNHHPLPCSRCSSDIHPCRCRAAAAVFSPRVVVLCCRSSGGDGVVSHGGLGRRTPHFGCLAIHIVVPLYQVALWTRSGFPSLLFGREKEQSQYFSGICNRRGLSRGTNSSGVKI